MHFLQPGFRLVSRAFPSHSHLSILWANEPQSNTAVVVNKQVVTEKMQTEYILYMIFFACMPCKYVCLDIICVTKLKSEQYEQYASVVCTCNIPITFAKYIMSWILHTNIFFLFWQIEKTRMNICKKWNNSIYKTSNWVAQCHASTKVFGLVTLLSSL